MFAVLGNNLVWEKQTYNNHTSKKKKKYDAGQAAVNTIVLAETKLWKD